MSKICFNKARFLLSVAKIEQLPPDEGMEVVVAGYSNAGKSSTLNALTRNKQLAKVSKTPGRTQCLNVFELGDQKRLVDLPGFGYAKVPRSVQAQWHDTIDQYLTQRQCLMGVVLILDSRHVLRSFEKDMIVWAQQSQLKCHIVLNKEDKLKRQQRKQAIDAVQTFIDSVASDASIQTLSTLKKTGIETLVETLQHWYEVK